MAEQRLLDRAYMKMAYDAAELSRATRRKVGAVLVVPEGGRFEGVNGMPSGFDNCCEITVITCAHNWVTNLDYVGVVCTECQKECRDRYTAPKFATILTTKKDVIHAESNAITKVARSTTSSIGSTLYTTLSPCFECAKLIIQAGVVRVVYSEEYPYPGHKGPERAIGLELLREAKIQVDNLPMDRQNDNDRDLHQEDEGYTDHAEEPWRGHNSP